MSGHSKHGRKKMQNKNLTNITSLLAAFLLLLPIARATADTVEIYTPESLTDVSVNSATLAGERRTISVSVLSTTGKKVMVAGKLENPAGVKMEIVNNGRSPVIPVMHDGYFHAGIVLSLGDNLLEVRWKRGDKAWNSKKLSLFRSSKLDGGVSSNYAPYVFHNDENEGRCGGCHQMRLTQEDIESGMEKNCLTCHASIAENVFVHGPVTVGICTVCHDPESTPNKYKVQDADDVLCYGCHTDRDETDSKKKLLHGPVGAGLCTVCHDPHSSPFEYQLVKSKNTICILCHQEDADRWSKEEYLHPPFRDGNCGGCHDPHSSDYKYNLKAPRETICALCHELPVPGHLHPVDVTPQFTLPEDFQLNEQGRTMCITCHDPHGAKGPGMTRGVGCDGCHPK